MSFTDETSEVMRAKGFLAFDSELGRVYIPDKGVELESNVEINYMRRPWLEAFEVTGVRPAMSLRKGPGTQSPETMIKLAYEIYSERLDDDMSPRVFVTEMTRHFIGYIIESEGQNRGAIKRVRAAEFLGWVENLWREGDAWCEQLVRDEILPMLHREELAWKRLMEVVTNEFKDWIRML